MLAGKCFKDLSLKRFLILFCGFVQLQGKKLKSSLISILFKFNICSGLCALEVIFIFQILG